MLANFEAKLDEMDERQFRALTGLSKEEFYKLLSVFAICYKEKQREKYEKEKDTRKREPGGGQKGRLDTPEKKLFFILYYYKVYPTFDVMGDRFALDRSKACTNVHKLTPVLAHALHKLGVLPKRKFDSVEEMEAAFAGIEDLFIDASERPHSRPKEDEEQKKKYSGKKKGHTVKNTVISDIRKVILFLGYTIFGSRHDYGQFKEEFPPDLDWFNEFKLWVDLGYFGIETDYEALEIHIPHKKPRKSKANPNPELTAEQKEENRCINQIRVLVEHAIGGIKRFNILIAKFRNRRENFVDDVALLTAGLWNWKLALKGIA